MAQSGASKGFNQLPPMIQFGIVLGGVVIVGAVVYKLIKKGTDVVESKEKREEERAWNQELDKLSSDPKTKPTLTKAEMLSLANKIHAAMDGYGTDEEAIIAAFKRIKTAGDFAGVQAAYGNRPVSSGTWNPAGNYHGPLNGALTDELSQYWKDLINDMMRKKGIKFQV